MKRYVLFQDRHDVPENDGPLCLAFDFLRHTTIKHEPNWENALDEVFDGGEVELIVTGLTPALCQFLQAYQVKYMVYVMENRSPYGFGKLYLMHYDKDTHQYFKQLF